VIRTTRRSRSVGKSALTLALVFLLFLNQVALSASKALDEGLRAYQRGAFDEAATKWQKAVEEYRRQANVPSQIKAMTDLAAAYEALGQQRRALALLEESVELAQKSGDRKTSTLAQSRLGAALVLNLKFERAETMLRESLESARAEGDSQTAAAILNELGNLLATQQKYPDALAAFRESAELASKSDRLLVAQALCNAGATAANAGRAHDGAGLNEETLKAIEVLKPSHDKAILLITAAQTD